MHQLYSSKLCSLKPCSSKFFLMVMIAISAFANIQSVAGDELIESCNQCHDGQQKDIPVIDGISSFALETSLLAYVDGSRGARPYEGQNMKTIVEKLTESEFKKILDHYPSKTFKPIEQAINTDLAAKGQKVHESYCARCHTEDGSLAEDDSSILAGQWKGYLIEEMRNYKNGSRTGDKKMLEVMQVIEDEHILALAEFYASQK